MHTAEQVVQQLPWRWNVQGRVFIIGGLGYMFDAWDVVLNGFLTPLVGDFWGLGITERGLVATANLIGMAIGAVSWGTVADKVGRKKAFSITMLIFAVFSVLAALAPSYWVFLLLRFLAGFGLGGCIPVDYAIVSEFSPARLRGRVLAAMDVWWPIGGTLCGLVATLLVPIDPDARWRIMLVFMVLPALLLFWVRRSIPESPIYLARSGREEEARAVVDDLVARTGTPPVPYRFSAPEVVAKLTLASAAVQLRDVWRFSPRITSTAWALFITIMLLYYGALSWMPSILRQSGYGSYAAFAGTTLMTGVGIIGVLVSSWLCEKVGRKWVIGVSGPVAALALVFFGLTLSLDTVPLIFLAVFGFVIQLTIPVLYAYVSELYPTPVRASGFGWASSVSRVASGFVPLLFGTLLWPTFGLPMTFAIIGGAVVAAVVWMSVGAPETKGRELDTLAPIAGEPNLTPTPDVRSGA